MKFSHGFCFLNLERNEFCACLFQDGNRVLLCVWLKREEWIVIRAGWLLNQQTRCVYTYERDNEAQTVDKRMVVFRTYFGAELTMGGDRSDCVAAVNVGSQRKFSAQPAKSVVTFSSCRD